MNLSSPRVSALALVLVCQGLSSCEKVRTVAAKWVSQKSPAEAAPASSPATPAPTAAGPQVVDLQETDFLRFIATADRLVIVDFHASWCGPCRQLGPVLERQVRATPGVLLGKVDVDRAPRLAAAQSVSGIPDVRFYKNGKEVHRFLGFPGEGEVKSLITRFSGDLATPPAAAPASQPAATPPAAPLTPASKDWLPPGMQRR